MIVREIKDNTEEILKDFDWFNDYKDTRLWAQMNAPEVLDQLDKGYEQWLKKQRNKNG